MKTEDRPTMTRRRLLVRFPAVAVTIAPAAALALSESPAKPDAVPATVPETAPTIEGRYSFVMIGDSAAPRYEEGETLYVDPNREPKVGDWCVWRRIDWEKDRISIAKLIGINPKTWAVERLDVEGWIELKRERWPHCHVICMSQDTRSRHQAKMSVYRIAATA